MHRCILALALQEKGRCGAQKRDRPRKVWQTERHGEGKTRGRGCLNKEETRRKRGGWGNKKMHQNCKCARRENGKKKDRKKDQDWKWKRASEKDCIEAVSVIFHCSTAIPANVPLQADCASAYLFVLLNGEWCSTSILIDIWSSFWGCTFFSSWEFFSTAEAGCSVIC